MRRFIPAFAIGILALELVSAAAASEGRDTRRIAVTGSLKTVPVPTPSNLSDFVKDKAAAIALGKALFWDMQTGGDGRQACASCHFQAGADSRSKNQLNPGANHMIDMGGANHQLMASDFPFHQLANPSDPNSAVIRDKDDVTGSQGVHNAMFNDIALGHGRDNITPTPDGTFNVGGLNVRRVTGRNTPSVINAVFNVRNFWDGRANNLFNGRNPFGAADAGARVLVLDDLGECVPTSVLIANASLASQAVGPPNNGTEMSANGRDWLKLGKKVCNIRPLDGQKVATDDSVLGPLAVAGGTGLSCDYPSMVRAAFQDKWWNSTAVMDGSMNMLAGMSSAHDHLNTNQFTMMECNMSLFWGLAIDLYESTLVSDDSPFDRFMDGDRTALTQNQQAGFGTFQSKCASCHSGAEFTSASFSATLGGTQPAGLITRMNMANGSAVYDRGFYNIGVRPTTEDGGIAGNDAFGNPLSISRREQLNPGSVAGAGISVSPSERIAVNGAFKVPSLRNVELTGPYFHNGSAATLQQVVEFYTRGGNFPQANAADLAPEINPIGKLQNKPADQMAVVDFLTSLTDDRVRFFRAPFDHPQLILNSGSQTAALGIMADLSIQGQAADETIELPATGAGGQATPVASFLGVATSSSSVAVNAGAAQSQTPAVGADFALSQPSPNPVAPRHGTTIKFTLPQAGNVDLEVYDVTGRAVKSLVKGTLAAGAHAIQWNGVADAGTRLPSGVYMYRLQAGKNSAERKLILVD